MKKINYELDSNNTIISWWTIPFNQNIPYLELDDEAQIYVGYSKVIDNKFIANKEDYLSAASNEAMIWEKKLKIAELKQKLAEMDYKTNKWLEGCYTAEEWEEIKLTRKSLRDKINELEQQLNA